jgi:hypothetical protein
MASKKGLEPVALTPPEEQDQTPPSTGASEPAADTQPDGNVPEPRKVWVRETPHEVIDEDGRYFYTKSPRGACHRVRKTQDVKDVVKVEN